METEKIDVPKFDGWECIGIHMPCELDFEVWVLDRHGSDLIPIPEDNSNNYKAQPCYRNIKPKRIVFEFTGEVRPPECGEYFKTDKSEFHIDLAQFDYQSKYEIYRIVEEQS